MKKVVLLVFLFLLIGTTVVFAQSIKVEGVEKSAAPDVINAALAERELGLEQQDTSNGDLYSGYFDFPSRLSVFHARYRFQIEGNAVTVSVSDIAVPDASGTGWVTPPIPPSGGSKQKLVSQLADRMNALKGKVTHSVRTEDSGTGKAAINAPTTSSSLRHVPRTDLAVAYAFDSDSRFYCSEGLCPLQRHGNLGFVDRNGKLVIDFIIRIGGSEFGGNVPVFSEGLGVIDTFVTKSKHRMGTTIFIDKKGERKFPNDEIGGAMPFREGVSAVTLYRLKPNHESPDAETYFMDHQGKLIPIQAEFRYFKDYEFHEGLALAPGEKQVVYVKPTVKQQSP